MCFFNVVQNICVHLRQLGHLMSCKSQWGQLNSEQTISIQCVKATTTRFLDMIEYLSKSGDNSQQRSKNREC